MALRKYPEIVATGIIDGTDWVFYVVHNEDDGSWEFHGHSGLTSERDMRVVGLETMVGMEPRVIDLADLPRGWHAWRDSPEEPWTRDRRQ